MLDRFVSRANPVERARGGLRLGEDDVLSVASRGELPADAIARKPLG